MQAMSRYPLFIPLFSLISGLIAANEWGYFPTSFLFLLLLAATLCLVPVDNRRYFLTGLCFCFFVGGAQALHPYLEPPVPPGAVARYEGGFPVTIDGVIDSRPEWLAQGGRISLQAVRVYQGTQSAAVTGRILLFVGEGRGDFLTGDRVRFVSRIRRPRNFGIPGEFDYERYLALREVCATAFVKDPSDMVLIRAAVAYPLGRFVDGIAADLGKRIGMRLPGDEGAILRALLLGESGTVPENIRDLYTRTGVNHILSISGFHVGVIAFFLFHLGLWLSRRSCFLLLRTHLRQTLLISTIPVLVFYLFLTGAAPATVRSVLMITAYLAALILERETDPIHSLSLAALVILAVSPAALFDISFQLSFLAIWGILCLTPLLMAPFEKFGKGPLYKFVLFFMVSVAATIATLIPVSLHFQRTTLIGLIANIFIIPLMGYGAVVLGFSSLPLLWFFPPAGGILLSGAGLLVRVSGVILQILDRLPVLPAWRTSRYELLLLVLFLAGMTLVRGRRLRLAWCVSLAALFCAAGIELSDPDAGKLRIDFFSVGQGESILVTFPEGKRMLVDGGGSLRSGGIDPGQRLLAPALRARGIDRLEYLVLTHSHPDHVKGLVFLARNFPIGEFWESGISNGDAGYRELKAALHAKQIPVRRIDATTGPISIGRARIEPLAPVVSGHPHLPFEGKDLNESSLVFRLGLDGFTVLFAGDIGPQTEDLLVTDPSALRCTILKVAHHGSRYSSSESFLDASSPACGVISAGYANSFGLPAPETLARLRQRGCAVYRTDLDGTVTVTWERGRWSVSTFRNRGHFH